MIVANHLYHRDRQLGGNLSFKRRYTWISEIDLCITKQTRIHLVTDVQVRQDIRGSDHALLCVTMDVDTRTTVTQGQLLQRAAALGNSHHEMKERHGLLKSVCYKDVNVEGLMTALQEVAPPEISADEDVDVNAMLREGCRVVLEAAVNHATRRHTACHAWDEGHPRWRRLLDTKDSKLIWKSVNWKGDIVNDCVEMPSEQQFKVHFEELLNAADSGMLENIEMENLPYIPVLDDPFTPNELEQTLNGMNVMKSYSRLCPGIVRRLPASWLIFFLTVFNVGVTLLFGVSVD
ncbi:hypothetical protein E2C01_053133 [Portunus trituberculatus]|uniref:Endonuclease/exonuclease/phosphatase domain-containing protein n=1 Tax=Portunus trituberculatus TaxID=210409 RepID=A0A5B7GPZ7_PORTR|nr:hypothetical protein [Portunus trituberculatus]